MTNFDEYNIFVDSDSTSEDPPDGSALNPYTNIDDAIMNSNPDDRILVKGENIITSSIILPHSLYFYGTNGAKIKYVNFNISNENIVFHIGDYTHSFLFENITFENAGEYAINCVKSKSIEIKNCIFQNCRKCKKKKKGKFCRKCDTFFAEILKGERCKGMQML